MMIRSLQFSNLVFLVYVLVSKLQPASSNIFSITPSVLGEDEEQQEGMVTFEEFDVKNRAKPCIFKIGEMVRNLQGREQKEIDEEEQHHHQTSQRHRRMVSVHLPLQRNGCDVINVDIPHDGVKMSFNKVKSMSNSDMNIAEGDASAGDGGADSNIMSPGAFSHWSGTESSNGSVFNFVQDNEGHLAGSLVDVANKNVFQFHSTHDGDYVVTITPSSDFPPEDDPHFPDEVPAVDIGARKLLRNRKSNENDTSSFLNIDTQWNDNAASLMLGQIKDNLSGQAKRKLYDDLGGNLDVMVVWTKKAECDLSGLPAGCTVTPATEANMLGLIDLAVLETNTAYQNSNINTELLLVHAYRHISYVETSFSQSLADIRTGAAPFTDVQPNRATYGADLVALIVYIPGSCGRAYVGPNINYMYSVTGYNCATGNYSFGHEIGHNLGCLHDRGTVGTCSDTLYQYGWRDPSANFRTVLAYSCVAGECDNNPGGSCSRVPYFSNPNTLYNNQAVGDANNDNARRINDVRATVAAYFPHSLTTPSPVPITPAPTRPPSPAFCGDGVCNVGDGEGCGSCSSDCLLPTHCNNVINSWTNGFANSAVYGIVFDVTVGSTNLYFYDLWVYILQTATAKVYLKLGSHTSDSNLLNWTKVFDSTISPGSNNRASMDFSLSRFYAPAGSTVAFYISYGAGSTFVYTQTGTFSNADISVLSGNIMREQIGSALPATYASGYDFLEIIRYDYAPSAASANPSESPSTDPISIPSSNPSSEPSSSPNILASPEPSSNPVESPSTDPISIPSSNPSSEPSSSPNILASPEPSSNPVESPSTDPISIPSSNPSSIPSLVPSVAPQSTTPAPAPTPTTSTCTCNTEVNRMRTEIEMLKKMLEEVVNHISTPGPSASTPTPSIVCVDRTGAWLVENSSIMRSWCTWVKKKADLTANRCRKYKLADDCPVACGVCSP